MYKILFVGGGSIGHIAPAITVWQKLKESDPSVKAMFVCSKRKDDASFLIKNNLSYIAIDAPKLSFSFIWRFPIALRNAKRIISSTRPDIIFSKGGYVSVPICWAAHKKGIPIILHESDTVSGRANRIVAKWASTICMGFPLEPLPPKSEVTGNPIRAEVLQGNKEEGQRLTGFSGNKSVLLVIGGSQGAQSINDVIFKLLPQLLDHVDIVHITGEGKGRNIQQKGYWSASFVNKELPHIYAITNIALSRAGAGSIGELAANNIPSILVPLRGVGHDHQQRNAEYVKKREGCILLQQDDLEIKLLETVQTLISNKELQQSLSEAMQSIYQADAATNIATVIKKHIAS